MSTIHQHLWLDNRHEAGVLRNAGVVGQRVRIGLHARRAREIGSDGNHCAPLVEASAQRIVLSASLCQSIEASGQLLVRCAIHRVRAAVNLDAGDDSFRLQDFSHVAAVAGRLS